MTSIGAASPQLRTARSAKLENGKALAQQPRNRRCRVAACDTVLSRYNPSPTCARHQGWQDDR
jgi:hypothetical protein